MIHKQNRSDKVFNPRHTGRVDIASESIEQLYEDNVVALHYDNERSVNPSDYKDSHHYAEGDFRRMTTAASEGAALGASYSGGISGKMNIGYVTPDTDIEFREVSDGEGGTSVIKVLSIENVTKVSFNEYPALFTASARQGAAFPRWRNAVKRVVRGIAYDESIDDEVFRLSEGQFELLCDVWLRMNHEDYYLRMPIGKSMEGVDIVATSKEGDINAQVTFEEKKRKVSNKRDELIARNDNPELVNYLFARAEMEPLVEGTNVRFVSPEKVFNEVKDNPTERGTLDAMLDLSRINDR
jgi:hypothetical protein